MADSLSPTVSVNHDSPLAVDSAISEDDGYDTHTLRESLMDYPVHWGRTYHRYKAGSYHYPNDEPELERYDFLHHIFTRIHQSNLFFAPVHDARRILDIGTGTGICKFVTVAGNKCRAESILKGQSSCPTPDSARTPNE